MKQLVKIVLSRQSWKQGVVLPFSQAEKASAVYFRNVDNRSAKISDKRAYQAAIYLGKIEILARGLRFFYVAST